MNNSKKKLQEIKNEIGNLEKNNKPELINKKNNGASLGFKLSTEIVAALVVGVGIGLVVG